MLIGSGHSSSAELKMNLGGPSGETLRKRQAAYTTMSSVLKYLSILNYKLTSCENSCTKAAPLIENESLLVYPAAIGNDGTALKPAIQFDERAKENVGLHYTFDLEYVKNSRLMSKETLQNNLVCEALVSSITSLDNSCSLPVAVMYATKAGKSGSEMKKLFTEQIKVLQLCENCQRRSKGNKLTIPFDQVDLCKSDCNDCLNMKKVCDPCTEKGFVSYIPSVRACKFCSENNLECVRRVIMVLTVDCEEGNKQCLQKFQEEIKKETIDPALLLLSLLPDCPHVLKPCKGSFANWPLQLINERGNLSLFYTL